MLGKFAAISDLHLGQTGDDGMGQYSLLSRAKTRPPASQGQLSVRPAADMDGLTAES
jgi:hypothetical protein